MTEYALARSFANSNEYSIVCRLYGQNPKLNAESRTYSSMSLHLQAFYTFDDGGTGVVYAVEEGLH